MTIAGNKLLTGITNVLFGSSLTDMETCYKVMRGEIARSLVLSADRFDIEPEITARLLRAGHRIVERPVRFAARSRAAGKKMRWRDGWMALRVLVCRATAPPMSAVASQSRAGAFLTLALSGIIGYYVGTRGFPEWQVPIESAQVLAGIVRYPPGNPFLIYHLKLWTMLHQMCAVAPRRPATRKFGCRRC